LEQLHSRRGCSQENKSKQIGLPLGAAEQLKVSMLRFLALKLQYCELKNGTFASTRPSQVLSVVKMSSKDRIAFTFSLESIWPFRTCKSRS
jgi:hypothetical protein